MRLSSTQTSSFSLSLSCSCTFPALGCIFIPNNEPAIVKHPAARIQTAHGGLITHHSGIGLNAFPVVLERMNGERHTLSCQSSIVYRRPKRAETSWPGQCNKCLDTVSTRLPPRRDKTKQGRAFCRSQVVSYNFATLATANASLLQRPKMSRQRSFPLPDWNL